MYKLEPSKRRFYPRTCFIDNPITHKKLKPKVTQGHLVGEYEVLGIATKHTTCRRLAGFGM